MTLTQKEQTLLKDLKEQEELCRDKYKKYAQSAKSTELSSVFTQLSSVEAEHYNTIMQMLGGNVPAMPAKAPTTEAECKMSPYSYQNEQDKSFDEFLCKDMLAMEKHVSSVYDTCVFEFNCSDARAVLNHIQTEEQEHGDKLYKYMSANGMMA